MLADGDFSALAVSLGLVLAKANNDVLRFLGLICEVILEDALGPVGITSLSVESGPRIMGHHSISTAKGVLRGTPDVVFGSGLDIPDIT
jgi:hypothetical protein